MNRATTLIAASAVVCLITCSAAADGPRVAVMNLKAEVQHYEAQVIAKALLGL